jgi:hypothetical protein
MIHAMQARAVCAALAWCSLASVCTAEDPLVKEETRSHDGWKCRLRISVTASPHVVVAGGGEVLISGTNVNFAITADFPPLTSPPDPPGRTWNHTFIDNLKSRIGNEPASPIEWQPGEVPKPGDPPGPPGVGHEVRFARTHFGDGSTIQIWLEGKFRVVDDDPEDSDQDTFSIELPLKVYNKAILLATVEEYVPGYDPPYVKQGQPGWPGAMFSAAAAAAIPLVEALLLGAGPMKHSKIDGHPSDARTWKESDGPNRLDQQMRWPTLFFAFTHGETTNFRSSYAGPPPDPPLVGDDRLVFSPAAGSEVATYVSAQRDVPVHNLVIMEGCSTLSSSTSYEAPKAFNVVVSSSENYPNRGYAGFTSPVHYQLLHPQGENLEKHAERLFTRLSQGDRLQWALWRTQGDNRAGPVDPDYKEPKSVNAGTSIAMVVRGDPYARLVNVYLSAFEWASVDDEVRDSWYWIRS